MKNVVYFIVSLILVAGCKDSYNPPVSSPATGYLVVEGFINNGPNPTSITLTRTTKLLDTVNIIYEHNARVNIEGNSSDSYPLHEDSNGIYTSGILSLNSSEQYRLHIYTTDGKEYISDYTPVKSTPLVDSISWQRDSAGVHIFINTHDPQNNTKYYQWQYEETWEFHSAFSSSLLYITDPSTDLPIGVNYRFPLTGYPDSSIYKCWQSPHSTSIILGTSEKLTEDKIYFPLLDIQAGAQQLSVLYSLNLKQHAVSKGNYEFLQKMKKNTEQVGSIFDAQPSELKGNIHCVSNPEEPVIGYMEVSQIQVQRIFISNEQLLGWGYSLPCKEVKIKNNADDIFLKGIGLIPTTVAEAGLGIVAFFAATPECVDCTLQGSNTKPDFWP